MSNGFVERHDRRGRETLIVVTALGRAFLTSIARIDRLVRPHDEFTVSFDVLATHLGLRIA